MSFELFYSPTNFVDDMLFLHRNSTLYVLKSHLKYSKTSQESFILAVNYIKIKKNADISENTIEITP